MALARHSAGSTTDSTTCDRLKKQTHMLQNVCRVLARHSAGTLHMACCYWNKYAARSERDMIASTTCMSGSITNIRRTLGVANRSTISLHFSCADQSTSSQQHFALHTLSFTASDIVQEVASATSMHQAATSTLALNHSSAGCLKVKDARC